MSEPTRSAMDLSPAHDPAAVYALGSNPGESARLQRQADELAADSAALLDQVGSAPGSRPALSTWSTPAPCWSTSPIQPGWPPR